MMLQQVFSIVSFTAACGWALLILLPGRRWVSRAAGMIIPGSLAAIYVVLIARYFPGANGGFDSLDNVARLFGHSSLLLAGWIHYLAFDLLIGNWEARDARSRGLPHWMLVPCLLSTFLFGPAGWLMYLGVRSFYSNGTVTVAGEP